MVGLGLNKYTNRSFILNAFWRSNMRKRNKVRNRRRVNVKEVARKDALKSLDCSKVCPISLARNQYN